MSRKSIRAAAAASALLLIAALTAACGGNSASADGLGTVTFGSQQVEADAGLFIADELGYFKDQGIKIKFQRLSDASAITNALATGHLDAAAATITPGTFQAGAQGLDIKIVGDKNFMAPPRGQLPAMSGTRLAVLPQYDKGNVKDTLAALKGKKLAIHSNLSIQIVYLGMFLKKYGYSLDDFDITPVLSPDQTAALKNGAIDAAVMQEPFFSQGVESGLVKPVSDLTEELPSSGVSTTALLYGKSMLANPDVGKKFMVAYMKGVRTYNDAMFYGKNKQKIVNLIASRMKVPADQIAKTYPPGLDPNQNIDTDWLSTCEKFYQDHKMLTDNVDPSDLVDTSFRDYAIKQLGEYKPPAKPAT